ncbi:MAG: diacylglycerol kinase family protein [Pseudomonadota bacterium]
MTNPKTAFIINPDSGGRKKDKLRKALIKKIAGMFPESPLEFSASADDASGLTRRMLENGFECIAVVGGDGSIRSVVEGFFKDERGTPVREGASLAVIPLGTGGDFRKTLGLDRDPLPALSLLKGPAVKPCDVGLVEYTDFEGKARKNYFINIASFGLGGLVDRYVQKSGKKLGGTLTFFFSTVKAFRNYKNATALITLDDKEKITKKSLLVTVANGRFFGSGMEIAPMADTNDGIFEIIVLGNLRFKDFALNSRRLYAGKKLSHPEIIYKSARKVKIEALNENEPMYLDLDGEPLGVIPATVKIFPSAINIKT